MKRNIANKWIHILCEYSKVGALFTVDGLTIKVEEDGDCKRCAFHNFGKGHYCKLMAGDGVIPCSGFNNNLAQGLLFVEQKDKQ